MNKDISLLMAIHQRDDIEENFDQVLYSIKTNSYIPDKFLLLIDGPINKSFQIKIDHWSNQLSFDIYQSNQNIGLAKILNIGLKKITTTWAIRIDGDDVNSSLRFQCLYDHLDSSLSVIGSYIEEINQFGVKRLKKVPLDHHEIKKYAKYRNPINHNSVIVRVDHLLQVGGYPDLYLKEDYGLWVKLLSKGYQFLNISEILVQASFNDRSYTRRSGMKYLKSDLELISLQYQEGLINIFERCYITILRVLFLLTPIFLKKRIYSFLR
jgi:hypothetical protein